MSLRDLAVKHMPVRSAGANAKHRAATRRAASSFVRLWNVKGIHKSAWLLAVASGLLQVLVFPRPNC